MNEIPENESMVDFEPAKPKPNVKAKKTRKNRKQKEQPEEVKIDVPTPPVVNELLEKEAVIEEKMDEKKCSDPNNYYSSECNSLLLEKEEIETQKFEETPETNNFLYPHLDDPNFNVKIAQKKEFSDTRYDGTIYNGQIIDGKKYGIKEHSEKLFNAEFSLQPHQAFVKNFLSFQTPYNSLLLYHGLGSGKTCSAIGVCEETREYMKQVGKTKRIIIVASPNVLDNFRLQLFNESKLKEVNGLWTAGGCIGNKILSELNPTNLKGLSKERIVSQVKNLINTSYLFFGYIEFARYIERISQGNNVNNIRKKIQNEFNDRLIVIDEVHNIRMADDNENKKVAEKLEELVTNAVNMRLLLLSATPMYNNCKEIVWLLNLMNINDRRAIINVKTIFDKDGNFKDGGKELLIRKARGYISFVRGDNPYMFPFRMFPSDFVPDEMYKNIADQYPSIQMNGKEINPAEKPENLDLYVTNVGEYQRMGYFLIMDNLKKQKNIVMTRRGERKMPSFYDLESISYVLLQTPLQSLNIVYPMDGIDKTFAKINPNEFYLDIKSSDTNPSVSDQSDSNEEEEEDEEDDTSDSNNTNENKSSSVSLSDASEEGAPMDTSKEDSEQKMSGGAKTTNYDILTGTNGLKRIMKYNPIEKSGYQYINTPFGHIFKPDQIGKYSSKIKTICDCIFRKNSSNKIIVSNGIVLIYSQYIDGGLIPMALALEELGFTRYGSKGSLFETPPSPPLDVVTMTPIARKKGEQHKLAKYAMITGDGNISPDNNDIVKAITNINNKEGYHIKVLLISKAGSEGIDLKFIRQIHVMEPWYNMNRIEQIIGRGVRSGSHRDLPFEERNVEIYLHGTNLSAFERIEPSDLYVYRTAHNKSKQIGEVTRVLKENSVDCIINHDQVNFTQANFTEPIVQHMSTGKTIAEYRVGDVDYSPHCDYKTCNYVCADVEKVDAKVLNTYSEKFMLVNAEHIIQIIKMLMLERHFYKKDALLNEINRLKHYPIEQINMALTQIIDNKEPIIDRYSHSGTLINIDEYYIFQPDELTNKKIGVFERMVPLDLKNEAIHLDLQESSLLKPELANPIIAKRNLVDMQEEAVEEEDYDSSRGKTILTEMTTKYSTAVNYAKIAKVERGDKDWYKYCGIAIRTLADKRIINADIISYLLVEHIVDELLYDDKLSLLNYFYKSGKINDNEKSFEYRVYNRLTYRTISFNGNTFMMMFDKNKQKKLLMLGENKVWKLAEEYFQENAKLEELLKGVFLIDAPYNKIIGFIDYDKKDDSLIFKTKDTEAKRTSGARCDESGKTTAIKRLNQLLNDPDNVFDSENTKGKVQQELCIYQEFILRNNDKNGDLKYFMTFEETCFHNLSKQ